MSVENRINEMLKLLSQFKEYNQEILEKGDKELKMSNGIPWLLFNAKSIRYATLDYKINEYRKNDTLLLGQEGDSCLLASFNDNHIEFFVNELGNLDEEYDIIIDHIPNAFYKNVDLLNVYEPRQTPNQKHTLDNIIMLLNIISDEISENNELLFLKNSLRSDIKTVKHTVFNQLNLHLVSMHRVVVDNLMSELRIAHDVEALSTLQKQFNSDSEPCYFENSKDLKHFVDSFDHSKEIDNSSEVSQLKTYIKVTNACLFIIFGFAGILIISQILQKFIYFSSDTTYNLVLFFLFLTAIDIGIDSFVKKRISKLNVKLLNNGVLNREEVVSNRYLTTINVNNDTIKIKKSKNVNLRNDDYFIAKKISYLDDNGKFIKVTNCTVRLINGSVSRLILHKTNVGSYCFTIVGNADKVISN